MILSIVFILLPFEATFSTFTCIIMIVIKVIISWSYFFCHRLCQKISSWFVLGSQEPDWFRLTRVVGFEEFLSAVAALLGGFRRRGECGAMFGISDGSACQPTRL